MAKARLTKRSYNDRGVCGHKNNDSVIGLFLSICSPTSGSLRSPLVAHLQTKQLRRPSAAEPLGPSLAEGTTALVDHVADDVPTAPEQNGRAADPKHRNDNRRHMSLLCLVQTAKQPDQHQNGDRNAK